MLKRDVLPKEKVKGNNEVRTLTVDGAITMSVLIIGSHTDIVEHEHEENEWEIYIDISDNISRICGIGKSHKFVSSGEGEKCILAIKGNSDTKEDELKEMFETLGMKVFLAK